MRLRLCAPAKLNLGLRVVGKRADGYHLLDTTFHAIDLHDVVELVDAEHLGLEVIGEGGGLPVPAGDDNLVLRAARAFFARAGLTPRGKFRLEKHIPAGGGLGGGSSDAAAALLLLQQRHSEPLSEAALAELAVRLGADVPFFLRAGTQRAVGIGEQLTAVASFPTYSFVLLVPPFGTSTAAVFKNYRPELTHAPPSDSVPRTNPTGDKALWGSSGPSTPQWHNDLETSAEQLYPDLGQLRARVAERGLGPPSMSGSGSTLFLTYADASAAADAVRSLSGLPGVRVLSARTADAKVGARQAVLVPPGSVGGSR
jgi:4-diphosphocytidyl-2-C-methyl-D-erythritol kinase